MGRNSKKYGLRIKLVFVCILLIFPLFVFGQEKIVRIALCYDSSTFVNVEYRRAITKTISRALQPLELNLNAEARFRSCPTLPPFSFYGSKEAIFGREEAMAAMIESAFWIAATEALNFSSGDTPESVLKNCGQLDWIDVYRLAKSRIYFQPSETERILHKIQQYTGFSTSKIDSIKDLVEKLHYHENDFSDNSDKGETFYLALLLYRSIIDNVTAFFIGHEMYHYNGDKFIIQERSIIEASGDFEKLANLQLIPRSLFDPNLTQADKQEIRADLSGYRVLQKVDNAVEISLQNRTLSALVRKSSINLIAYPLLMGFDLSDLEVDKAPTFFIRKSYLYPELRLLLLSDVLNKNETSYPWSVKLCGNTARAIVTMIQQHVTDYPNSNGDVPNEILHLLPKGVTVGWETNHWDNHSFDCFEN